MKKFNYEFIKLFAIIKEGEDFFNCFIAFKKVPLSFENIDMGRGMGKEIPVEWGCLLYINLYFVRLRFRWNKKVNVDKIVKK